MFRVAPAAVVPAAAAAAAPAAVVPASAAPAALPAPAAAVVPASAVVPAALVAAAPLTAVAVVVPLTVAVVPLLVLLFPLRARLGAQPDVLGDHLVRRVLLQLFAGGRLLVLVALMLGLPPLQLRHRRVALELAGQRPAQAVDICVHMLEAPPDRLQVVPGDQSSCVQRLEVHAAGVAGHLRDDVGDLGLQGGHPLGEILRLGDQVREDGDGDGRAALDVRNDRRD